MTGHLCQEKKLTWGGGGGKRGIKKLKEKECHRNDQLVASSQGIQVGGGRKIAVTFEVKGKNSRKASASSSNKARTGRLWSDGYKRTGSNFKEEDGQGGPSSTTCIKGKRRIAEEKKKKGTLRGGGEVKWNGRLAGELLLTGSWKVSPGREKKGRRRP